MKYELIELTAQCSCNQKNLVRVFNDSAPVKLNCVSCRRDMVIRKPPDVISTEVQGSMTVH